MVALGPNVPNVVLDQGGSTRKGKMELISRQLKLYLQVQRHTHGGSTTQLNNLLRDLTHTTFSSIPNAAVAKQRLKPLGTITDDVQPRRLARHTPMVPAALRTHNHEQSKEVETAGL